MVRLRHEDPVYLCPICNQVWRVTSKGLILIPTKVTDLKPVDTSPDSPKVKVIIEATIPFKKEVLLCPFCEGQTVKLGLFFTQKDGFKQRYRCKACARTFYIPKETPDELKRK